MKQSYLFLEWINNNFKLNVYDGISIISLINGINENGSVKDMIQSLQYTKLVEMCREVAMELNMMYELTLCSKMVHWLERNIRF